jgi:hypothetical protein
MIESRARGGALRGFAIVTMLVMGAGVVVLVHVVTSCQRS